MNIEDKAESVIDKLSKLVLSSALSTVAAPFRVVDSEGKRIFEVSVSDKGTDRRIQVFNKNEEAAAALGSDINGGNLVIKDNAERIISYLRVGPDGARFSLDTSNGLGGVDFCTDEDGGGIVVPTSTPKPFPNRGGTLRSEE